MISEYLPSVTSSVTIFWVRKHHGMTTLFIRTEYTQHFSESCYLLHIIYHYIHIVTMARLGSLMVSYISNSYLSKLCNQLNAGVPFSGLCFICLFNFISHISRLTFTFMDASEVIGVILCQYGISYGSCLWFWSLFIVLIQSPHYIVLSNN